MEVHDIVQEAMKKNIPKKKKCKKAKWLSEEADVKGKGEKEKYTHLNADVKVTQLFLTFVTSWTI